MSLKARLKKLADLAAARAPLPERVLRVTEEIVTAGVQIDYSEQEQPITGPIVTRLEFERKAGQ